MLGMFNELGEFSGAWFIKEYDDLDGLYEMLQTASLPVLRHYERAIIGVSDSNAQMLEDELNWMPLSRPGRAPRPPPPVKTNEQLMAWRRERLCFHITSEKARRAAIDTANRTEMENWRSGRERQEILAEHASLVRTHAEMVYHIEELTLSFQMNMSQSTLYTEARRFWDQRVKNYKKDRESAARVAVELETHQNWQLERKILREENASIQNSKDIGFAYIEWLKTTNRSHAPHPNQPLR